MWVLNMLCFVQTTIYLLVWRNWTSLHEQLHMFLSMTNITILLECVKIFKITFRNLVKCVCKDSYNNETLNWKYEHTVL